MRERLVRGRFREAPSPSGRYEYDEGVTSPSESGGRGILGRTWVHLSFTVLVAFIVVTLVLPSLASANPAPGSRLTDRHGGIRRVLLPDSASVGYVLASHGRTTLFSYQLTNGSAALAELSAATGRLTDIEVLSGGSAVYVSGIAWADHRFLVSIFNISSGVSSFQTISGHGPPIATVLSLPEPEAWTVLDSVRDQVFVGSPGALLALSDDTFQVQSDFSSLLPAGAGVNSVAAFGSQLYIGGAITPVSGGAFAFYGAIELRTDTLTVFSPTVTQPSDYITSIFSVVVSGGWVYFTGGATILQFSPSFELYSDGPILLAYHPTDRSWVNLSALLPPEAAADQAVVLGGYVGIMAPEWNLSTGVLVAQPGFFLTVPGSTTLHNDTAVVGNHLAVLAQETAASSGFLFAMGEDLTSGETAVVAIPFESFDLR